MMLIGQGGSGNSTSGGGSGAVTVWYGAAQHVPDSLVISVPLAGTGQNTDVIYRSGAGPIILLAGARALGAGGGVASTANPFTASGFYQSTAGQAGSSVEIDRSTTTFLSGGGPSSNFSVSNYGYQRLAAGNANGFFILQPIIVGGGSKGANQVSGLGCGGGTDGAAAGSPGGPGMVLIASW